MLRLISRLTARPDPRGWASAPRCKPYWVGLGVLVLAYVASLGWLLVYTGGLPYVLDNNETFSSLVHARNIYRFGVRETFGLTDESYGLEAAQHPYVYTHGGNLPRFYTLLLYVLGAHTAEAQIVVTTFTVGLTGLLLAYIFFSRVATPLFALVYCLLLMTDYVMQTQWLVNTWRTWHHFLFFSSLLCVHGLLRRHRPPRWLAAVTLLNFACLVYLELVFATLVTLLATVYAGLVGWRRPRRVLRAWLLVGGGAALGAAVLTTQLIGYLGWEGYCEDLRLTFLARNATATDLSAFRSEVWSFVEAHRLVFWDNFLAGAGTYSSFFRWCLLTYSPALVFVVLLISTAWALSSLSCLESTSESRTARLAWSARSAIPWVTGPAVLFACAILMDVSFAGLTDGGRRLGNVGALGAWAAGTAVGGIGLAALRGPRGREGDGSWLPPIKVLVCAAFLVAFAALARFHPRLYGDGVSFAPLFRELIGKTGGATVWRLAALGGGALAVSLVLAPRFLLGRERRTFRRLVQFVIAGVVAVVMVFGLFPGYVASGYLTRHCPLTIYLHLVPFAATFYVLARASLTSVRALAAAFRVLPLTTLSFEKPAESGRRTARWPQLLASAGALLLFCVLSGYWLILQARWIGGLDPRATLLKELGKPQYQGASFVVSAYAAPVAFIVKGWAYADPQFGKSELRRLGEKFYQRRDFRYLWLADKHSNRSYFEPDYFVCWMPQRLFDAIAVAEKCQELRIVAEARAGTSLVGHREVSLDESGRDAWSVIKLNWTYPPGSGRRIEWDERQYRRALALPW